LHYSLSTFTRQAWLPQQWTVIGTVRKDPTTAFEDVSIGVLPPLKTNATDNGDFSLVVSAVSTDWPRLLFQAPGYHPKRIVLDGEAIDAIVAAKREIRLKDIVLFKNDEYRQPICNAAAAAGGGAIVAN